MYSLNCNYYTEKFFTVEELIHNAISNCVDLDCEILFNDRLTGEILADLIQL
jgi:hypothetical protein